MTERNYTLIWPVEGVCDLGCPFYREGSLESEKEAGDIPLGSHCRFKKEGKKEAGCGATERHPACE